MEKQSDLFSRRAQWFATALIAILQLGLLVWAYMHGGIPSHHVLNRADLPTISNAWGLITLPALTWWAFGRVCVRIAAGSSTLHGVVIGLALAFVYGATMALSFVWGVQELTGAMFLVMLLLTTVLPLHRAECLTGFVLAMTPTFGGVLPLLVGLVVGTLAALAHVVIYPRVLRVWKAQLQRR